MAVGTSTTRLFLAVVVPVGDAELKLNLLGGLAHGDGSCDDGDDCGFDRSSGRRGYHVRGTLGVRESSPGKPSQVLAQEGSPCDGCRPTVKCVGSLCCGYGYYGYYDCVPAVVLDHAVEGKDGGNGTKQWC